MNTLKRNYILILSIAIISVIMHAQTPVSEEYWFMARLSIGLFGLIYLPGLLSAIAILHDEHIKAGFSFLFGFMLELLNIFAIWAFHIFYGPVSFALSMYILTLTEIVLIITYLCRRKIILSTSKIIGQFKLDPVLVAVVVLYLAVALYWQQWAPSPHSDGAAYLDMARNVVKKGTFQSNMVFPNNTWEHVEYSSGMHAHMFGYFAISLFFLLGNVSLLSAKIMLIFAGMLIIVVVYELTKKLLNLNVARLAALIVAISPELLTHVGLVGGPEVPSALFILFTTYFLVQAPSSNRKVSMGLVAGLSLFIAWYAWLFNFLVMLTFLPLLFVYVTATYEEFKFTDILLTLLLIASLVLEYRVLLAFTDATIGITIPSLFIVALVAIYLLRLRRGQNKKTMVIFTTMFLIIYLMLYGQAIASSVIPQAQEFRRLAIPTDELATANIARDVDIFSRAFNIEAVNEYWTKYWDGVYRHLGAVVVFLGLISLARVDKLKESLLIISFPLLQAVWWSLFAMVDEFQPRFIVCSSLFYFMLVALVFEMLCSYATRPRARILKARRVGDKVSNLVEERERPKRRARVLNNAKPVNVWPKVAGVAGRIRVRSLVKVFVLLLLLLSLCSFTYIIFSYNHQIMEYWNYPHNLGWDPAIRWVRENTRPDDVLMARQGNYWAWFTERKTVMLTPVIYGSINESQLIFLIRKFEVKYLIIDYRLYTEFPQLGMLYSSSLSFNGSPIEFQSVNEQNYKTIIYNVTNIGYSNS